MENLELDFKLTVAHVNAILKHLSAGAYAEVSDIIAYYGDSIIFALMIMYLADNFDAFDVARYSGKQQGYIIRSLSYDKFTG